MCTSFWERDTEIFLFESVLTDAGNFLLPRDFHELVNHCQAGKDGGGA